MFYVQPSIHNIRSDNTVFELATTFTATENITEVPFKVISLGNKLYNDARVQPPFFKLKNWFYEILFKVATIPCHQCHKNVSFIAVSYTHLCMVAQQPKFEIQYISETRIFLMINTYFGPAISLYSIWYFSFLPVENNVKGIKSNVAQNYLSWSQRTKPSTAEYAQTGYQQSV